MLLKVRGLGRAQAVRDVDLELRAGEIMGLAGLVGSGRTEAAAAAVRRRPRRPRRVTLEIDGRTRPRAAALADAAMRDGIGLVTEDRKSQGLLLAQSIRVNATLSDLRRVARVGWLQFGRERGIAQRLIGLLRIRCRGPNNRSTR